MEPQPSSMKPSSRRAVRARSRIVFFLLRRALRRLQGGVTARIRTISRRFGHGPRALRLEH